jgi:hypothetical protein
VQYQFTWIGKENRSKLEPRILLEDPEKSQHAKHRVGDHDLFDNRLIFGDNLLALKALEQDFADKVKCINHDQLPQLSDEVGPNRSLLVMCSAFRGKADPLAEPDDQEDPEGRPVALRLGARRL